MQLQQLHFSFVSEKEKSEWLPSNFGVSGVKRMNSSGELAHNHKVISYIYVESDREVVGDESAPIGLD